MIKITKNNDVVVPDVCMNEKELSELPYDVYKKIHELSDIFNENLSASTNSLLLSAIDRANLFNIAMYILFERDGVASITTNGAIKNNL